ncbi:MAG: hypothetical protein V1493_00855, partial [Candidatus Diapherotrites archaeon]
FRNSSNGALMERIGVKMDELEIGRRIMDCLSLLGTGADFSKPEPFKCEWCDPEFRAKCRLRQES